MESVIDAYRKLKYLTETIDESTTDRLREYNEELAVPLNSLPVSVPAHITSLKKHTSNTSSSTSILSQKSAGTAPTAGTNNNPFNPTIPEVDHDSEHDLDEEDTNAMFIRDKFHIRNDQLFADNAATSKELVDLLSSLSNEEIQPILDEIISTTFELDDQRQESQYEENYDLFQSLIQKMKQSSGERVGQMNHSLQLLIHRQREIFDITTEKYKQEYGFYRMKNRHVELVNLIQKYSFKLSEMKYELSMKQEEFNVSAEELRNRYEQELEEMIRKLLTAIEDKKQEVSELTSKHESIQADIQRICNDLSVVLHELEREEKAKAYAAIYGNNKKYIDNRPAPPALPTITTEKIEEAFAQARMDQNSLASIAMKRTGQATTKTDNNNNKAGNSPGKTKNNNRSPKANSSSSPSNKGGKTSSYSNNNSNNMASEQSITTTINTDNNQNTINIMNNETSDNDEYDVNHIFQVFPFLETHEISEDNVSESLRITDSLLLEVEGKKKELQEQEEIVNAERQKTQNLLKSEENKALERLKLMVGGLEGKIEADGKRVELLQTLVKNLTSETKGDHGNGKPRYKSFQQHPNSHNNNHNHRQSGRNSNNKDEKDKDKDDNLASFDHGSGTAATSRHSAGEASKSKEHNSKDSHDNSQGGMMEDYENMSEVEVNVLKYQEFYEKCQSILKTERDKILSREKTPRTASHNSRPLSTSVTTVKPFSANNNNDSENNNNHNNNTADFNETIHIDNNSNERQNIKRIIIPQQVSKIHKIMEMFDYYTNLNELSEVDKASNTLIPYSNLPLGWNSSKTPSSSKGNKTGGSGVASRMKSRDSPSPSHSPSRAESPSRSGLIGLGPSPSGLVTHRSTRPVSQRSIIFQDEEQRSRAQSPSQHSEIDNLNSFLGSNRSSAAATAIPGRRSAIASPQSRHTHIRSRSPGSIEDKEDSDSHNHSHNQREKANYSSERESSYQLTLNLKEQENQQFFSENYGYKLALEQISTIYNILLKWNYPTADQMTASNILNHSIILQTDREENELLTIEVLKSQIQNLLLKCKTLYKQNTYFHSIVKDLSKELIQDIKKNNHLTSELIAEISNLKWGQNTLPGKYQLEIDAAKERLMQLKKDCKVWEAKVAKRRVTNIRLSHLLSENSKSVRKAMPLKSSFQMIQAMVQESNSGEEKDNHDNNESSRDDPLQEGDEAQQRLNPNPSPNPQLRSHVPILYSSSLSHGPQPFSSIPIQLETSLTINNNNNTNHRPATQHTDLGIDLTASPLQPLQPSTTSNNNNNNTATTFTKLTTSTHITKANSQRTSTNNTNNSQTTTNHRNASFNKRSPHK